MKRVIGFLILVAVLMVPTVGFTADNQNGASVAPDTIKQIGVYVAPKFVYGLTQMDGVKVHENNKAANRDSYVFNIGNKLDSTFGGSIAIGYDFSKRFNVPIRAELEYAAFSKAEADKDFTVVGNRPDNITYEKWSQSHQVQTLFLNGYWDINTGTQFTPYVGAGLGMGFIATKFGAKGATYNSDVFQDSWDEKLGSRTVTNFAWNVGAGLGFDINDYWTIDAGYRFVGLGSVKTGTYSEVGGSGNVQHIYGKTEDLYQHQFSLGVRCTF